MGDGLDSILEYHIDETSKRFTEVKEDLSELKLKMDELKGFKIEMLATSRLVSMIISATCGIITLTVSTIVSIKFH